MSLVIAVKDGDRVIFGADTLITNGDHISRTLKCESNYKVLKLTKKVLVASTGLVSYKHAWVINNHLFDKVPKEGLTKEFLVNNILPTIREYMQNNNMLDENGNYDGSFVIACESKLFYIESTFAIYEINDYVAIGVGKNYADIIMINNDLPIKEKILKAIEVAQKDNNSVGLPAIFIDTKDMKYEIVGGIVK